MLFAYVTDLLHLKDVTPASFLYFWIRLNNVAIWCFEHLLFRGQTGEESRGDVLAGDQAFPAEASHKPGNPSALTRCGHVRSSAAEGTHNSLSFGPSVFHSVCLHSLSVCVCVCSSQRSWWTWACWWRFSCWLSRWRMRRTHSFCSSSTHTCSSTSASGTKEISHCASVSLCVCLGDLFMLHLCFVHACFCYTNWFSLFLLNVLMVSDCREQQSGCGSQNPIHFLHSKIDFFFLTRLTNE